MMGISPFGRIIFLSLLGAIAVFVIIEGKPHKATKGPPVVLSKYRRHAILHDDEHTPNSNITVYTYIRTTFNTYTVYPLC